MAYVINRYNGQRLVVLEDGTLDTSTSIGLLGKNYTGYGEVQNENFLHLLENFSNNLPPARPVSGQTWFNTTTNALNVYNGNEWIPVGSATLDNIEPTGIPGSLWYKTETDQLFVYYNDTWNLIGPEAVTGFGATKANARTILGKDNNLYPVIEFLVDGTVIAIASKSEFIIDDSNLITGFNNIKNGINISSTSSVIGTLDGNAFSATRLQTARTINGVAFDGQTNITIRSSTTQNLVRGTYLTGSNFDGSTQTTWSVDATPSNSIGKVVARDSNGDFSAGTITANLIGNVTGNISSLGTSTFNRVEANEFVGATLSGNANTATRLETARTINGVAFDGTENITVRASAETLTGIYLASTVTSSNLNSVGLLSNLSVNNPGITVGTTTTLDIKVATGGVPTIETSANVFKFITSAGTVDYLSPAQSLMLGGEEEGSIVPQTTMNLGISTKRWSKAYANYFVGIATSAQYADLAEKYVSDKDYEPGTILEFGGDFEVTEASSETPKVAGIVSTNPAYLMNSECSGDYVVSVALQGRVPCKVTGKVSKGDMLVSAGKGYAKSSKNPSIGTVIGKALCDFDGDFGVIEAVVGRI